MKPSIYFHYDLSKDLDRLKTIDVHLFRTVVFAIFLMKVVISVR